MEKELLVLEVSLKSLVPAKLGESLDSRLIESIEPMGSMPMIEEQAGVSVGLYQVQPAGLSPAFAEQLESILSRVPHPDSHKLLSFPEIEKTHQPGRLQWRQYAVAAAVALLGVISAFMVPSIEQKSAPLSSASASNRTESEFPGDSLVPASYQSNLRDASDEGIVWQSGGSPQRMLKLIYIEHVTLKDSEGREFQVERPRIRYVMVPAQID